MIPDLHPSQTLSTFITLRLIDTVEPVLVLLCIALPSSQYTNQAKAQ